MSASAEKPVLTIRSHSGLSGDMLLAGLGSLALAKDGIAPDSPAADEWLAELCADVSSDLAGCLTIRSHFVHGISGWQAQVNLPHAHEHRHEAEIREIISQSGLNQDARATAAACFALLAECEAEAHGIARSEVHFHEVGALDSILDVLGTCELFQRLGAPFLIASPLPVADGEIVCAHGILPAPAPAVIRLLNNVPVYPFPGRADAGELVTPTAIALLKSLGTNFGPWPRFAPGQSCLVYGAREFEGAANGALFVLGKPL